MAEARTPVEQLVAPGRPTSPNIRMVLLKMLPGFLPLIIYVVAEGFWGETVGLITGIAGGVAEFAILLIKNRRPDWLAFCDTFLLAGMGGVSIALQDDIFFKIKPAVIELVMAVLVGISAFGSQNLLMGRTLNSLKAEGLDLAPAEQRMQAMMRGLFILLLIHIGLTVAAAFWWSKEVWLFVSGGLLYVMMGIWAAGILGKMFLQIRAARKQSRPTDMADQ